MEIDESPDHSYAANPGLGYDDFEVHNTSGHSSMRDRHERHEEGKYEYMNRYLVSKLHYLVLTRPLVYSGLHLILLFDILVIFVRVLSH